MKSSGEVHGDRSEVDPLAEGSQGQVPLIRMYREPIR